MRCLAACLMLVLAVTYQGRYRVTFGAVYRLGRRVGNNATIKTTLQKPAERHRSLLGGVAVQ